MRLWLLMSENGYLQMRLWLLTNETDYSYMSFWQLTNETGYLQMRLWLLKNILTHSLCLFLMRLFVSVRSFVTESSSVTEFLSARPLGCASCPARHQSLGRFPRNRQVSHLMTKPTTCALHPAKTLSLSISPV